MKRNLRVKKINPESQKKMKKNTLSMCRNLKKIKERITVLTRKILKMAVKILITVWKYNNRVQKMESRQKQSKKKSL